METTDLTARVAKMLDQLADGESVVLGEFGDNADSMPADEDAMLLREIAEALRRGEGPDLT